MIEGQLGEYIARNPTESELRRLAEISAGKPFNEIARESGLSVDQAGAVVLLCNKIGEPLDRLPRLSEATEQLKPDEYTPPNLVTVFDGGGTTWVPLFSAEGAKKIHEVQGFQKLPDEGLLHFPVERKSLQSLLEGAEKNDPIAVKALSMRCLEISILSGMMQDTERSEAAKALLKNNMTGEKIIQQAIASKLFTEDDRKDLTNTPQSEEKLLERSLLRMRLRIGQKIKHNPVSKDETIFFPHRHPGYADVMSRYVQAKTAPPILKA